MAVGLHAQPPARTSRSRSSQINPIIPNTDIATPLESTEKKSRRLCQNATSYPDCARPRTRNKNDRCLVEEKNCAIVRIVMWCGVVGSRRESDHRAPRDYPQSR